MSLKLLKLFFLSILFPLSLYANPPADDNDESYNYVLSVYKDYKAGKYDKFLANNEAAIKSPQAQRLIDDQRSMAKMMVNNKERVKTIMQEFDAKNNALKKDRNQKLAAACNGHENEMICQLVQKIINTPIKERFNDASVDNDILLSQDTSDPFVKKFLDIMQLGMVKQALVLPETKNYNVKLSDDALNRHRLVLQFQQNDLFRAIAAENSDHPVSKQLALSDQIFLQRAADARRNNSLRTFIVDHASHPDDMTPLVKEIDNIMRSYWKQSGELTKSTFANINLKN